MTHIEKYRQKNGVVHMDNVFFPTLQGSQLLSESYRTSRPTEDSPVLRIKIKTNPSTSFHKDRKNSLYIPEEEKP